MTRPLRASTVAAFLVKAAAVSSLALSVAGAAVAKADKPRPPPSAQPDYRPPPLPPAAPPQEPRSQPVPDSVMRAPPSAVSVMTERQKYCRWQNHCPMQGPPCPPCRGL